MVVQPLPYSLSANTKTPPVFADHHFFTGSANDRYVYPEHAAAFGILSMFSGSGNYFINGQKITASADSYAVVNYGSKLAIELSKEPAFLFFRCDFNPSVDLAYLERTHIKTKTLNDTLRLLPRLGESCSSFHSLKADGIIRSIIEQLMLQGHRDAQFAANLNVVKRSTRIELYRRLALAKDWIDTNYFLPVTLEQMANVAALNSQHFLRMFKECFGLTPHQYLTNIRLDHSQKMLMNTNEPIAVVCNNVGFESLSSFSWLFRQRFGTSPTQFRNNFKK